MARRTGITEPELDTSVGGRIEICCCIERTRGVLESPDASSTVGFVLTHAGYRPARVDLFDPDLRPWSLA